MTFYVIIISILICIFYLQSCLGKRKFILVLRYKRFTYIDPLHFYPKMFFMYFLFYGQQLPEIKIVMN